MEKDVKEILISEEEIMNKCEAIGRAVSNDYKDEDLVVVGILKGSIMFISDLMKKISIPVELDFMAVSSYGKEATSSGVVRILKDLDTDIEGKCLLIVEDIIDTGNTLAYLTDYLKARKAKRVDIACLLDKKVSRKADIDIKYVGFDCPDEFIIGYGIDYAEHYRNLPYIASLKEEVYRK